MHVLIAGANAAAAAKAAAQIVGVTKVLHADGEQFAHGLAENVAAQVLAVAKDYSHILFPATAAGTLSMSCSRQSVPAREARDTPSAASSAFCARRSRTTAVTLTE